MVKFLFQLFDRFLFSIALVIGMQLPEFIQQYRQRIGGHLDEVIQHLAQFQAIANRLYQGDLTLLTSHYLDSADRVMQQTGELLQALVTRQQLLQTQFEHLLLPQYFDKMYHFIKELNYEIALATWRHYQLAIPLTVEALATGAVVAVLFMLINKLLCISLIKLSSKQPVSTSASS
jgi:hypothetical protein